MTVKRASFDMFNRNVDHAMINIRRGNIEDIYAIAELLIDTWRNSYASIMPADFISSLDLEKQVERHAAYMNDRVKYFVAENTNEELIGFVSYGVNRVEKIACKYELYTLYVNIKDHGKGIGRLLLNSVLLDIDKEEDEIVVLVFQDNPFKRFYVKNNFTEVDEEIIDMGGFEMVSDILLRPVIMEGVNLE